MKITVERSGGFAGVVRRGTSDGAALTAEQHDALQALMSAPAAPAAPAHSDTFMYRVEVQDDTGTQSRRVPEAAMPPSLRSLATEQ